MRASVYIFCIVTRWSPQNFPFIWKFNEMESNKLLDSFCTKFVWVYLLLLCRSWGVCEKKKSTTIFYLSTQRFQCNKRAHVFFWRMQWFIVSWLGNDTFVFDVILFTFFLSYIYHTIFISNRCFKVSKLIAWIWHQNHCHSNNLKGKKRRAKMEFIIYLQTKSHLWIFNAVWTFMFFLFRMMSNIMLLFLLKWRWKKSYLYICIKKKNQNHNRNELEPDRNNSH